MSKTEEYRSWVEGTEVARMIIEFQRDTEFVYGPQTGLFAVGPLQTFLGWAASRNAISFGGLGRNGT